MRGAEQTLAVYTLTVLRAHPAPCPVNHHLLPHQVSGALHRRLPQLLEGIQRRRFAWTQQQTEIKSMNRAERKRVPDLCAPKLLPMSYISLSGDCAPRAAVSLASSSSLLGERKLAPGEPGASSAAGSGEYSPGPGDSSLRRAARASIASLASVANADAAPEPLSSGR